MSAMTSFVSHTSVDCRDAYALSTWWKQVLGYVDVADDPNEPGDEECMILSADAGHRLLFIEVPEAKQVKNRLHLDLRPSDGTRAEEVRRLLGIGATVVADHSDIHGPGIGWVTMADPEGNEFCVLRSEAEIAAASGGSAGGSADGSIGGSADA
jgi:catechol 2,3-dioxygenase-like lactoylglutathione lyase family enzyme